MATEQKTLTHALGWPVRFAAILIASGVLAFYFWTAASGGTRASFWGDSPDYYNLLVRGFLDGQLHMKVTPDPALRVELPNRVVSPGAFFLLDASYYHGKYYLYFGATPALTLFLPWKIITGHEFPEWAAVPLLASLAYVIALGWLARLRRAFFFRAGGLNWLVVVLAAGLANGVPVVLRRPLFYEVAVTAGWLWSVAALGCLTEALLRPARATRWLAAAGVCAGFAVGSRPTLIAGAAVAFAWVVGWRWWTGRKAGGKIPVWRWLAAAGSPLCAAVAGLLWYNWARFENPFEFGLHYQLGSNGNGFPFTIESLLKNLRVYYFTPPDLGWFFPYVAPGPKPVGYYFEQVHGQFWFLPFLIFSVFALLPRGQNPESSRGLKWPVVLVAWAWAGASLVLVGMAPVQSNRYALDFHPIVFTGALAGVLAAAHAGWRWRGRAAAAWLAGLMFLNVAASWHVHHFFQEGNPPGFERLARWCDRALWPLWRWTNPALGAIEASVVFPSGVAGRVEVLVVAGAGTDLDSFRVHYLDAGHARLMFDHPGVGSREGPGFALRPGESRKLVFSAGTFCPPVWHPWYDDLPPEASRLASHVRVTLDGTEVLSLDSACYPAAPGQLSWGRRREPVAGEAAFRGTIGLVRSLGPDLTWLRKQQAESGPIRMRVRFLQDRIGLQEPLVIAGEPESFDLVCVRYEDAHTIRVGMHHAGWQTVRFSGPLKVDYDQTHEFEIDLGALTAGAWLPPDQREIWRERGVNVRLDGQTVLSERFVAHPATWWQMYVGCTPFPVDTSRRLFGGQMDILPRRGVSRADVGAALRMEKPLHLRLRLPRGNSGRQEPLLTTGVPGKGDGLYVKYLDDGHVSVGFDHWGVGGQISPPIAVNYEAEQEWVISWGGLLAPTDPGRGRLRVVLNEIAVMDVAQAFHPATREQAAVGLNPIGLSTADAAFTGQILSVDAR